MSADPISLPGGRDARASLDAADDSDTVVVACPPHPQHRGHRGDERLVAVGDALVARGVDCLRFDYGPWDRGRGERTDARNAVRWAGDRYDRVGLFGFSFGATVALATAGPARDRRADDDPADRLAAVAALAPTARINADGDDTGGALDAVAALDRIRAPTLIAYGSRDDTADWRPVVERARELDSGIETVDLAADHFFVGRAGDVGRTVADFLVPRLAADCDR